MSAVRGVSFRVFRHWITFAFMRGSFQIALGNLPHRIMVWDGNEERQIEAHWGLKSRDPEIGQIPLLKSETARIEKPSAQRSPGAGEADQ